MCCSLWCKWCKGVQLVGEVLVDECAVLCGVRVCFTFYMCVSGTMTDKGMVCVHVGITVRRITLL